MRLSGVIWTAISRSCLKQNVKHLQCPTISAFMVTLEPTPSINLIQCREKRTHNYPTPPPIEFRSGDMAEYEAPPKDDILYKYRHIEGIDGFHPDLKKLFTVEQATEKEMLEHQHMLIQSVIHEKMGPGLSYEKLIAYLTVNIRQMMSECQNDRSNKKLKHYTFQRIAKRHKFINYLRQHHYESYLWLMKELNIKFEQPHPQDLKRKTRRELRYQDAEDEMNKEKEQKRIDLQKMFQVEKQKFLKYKKAVLEEITADTEKHDIDVGEILQTFKEEQDKKNKVIQAKPVKMGRMFQQFYEDERKRKELQLKIIPNPYVLGTKK